MAVSTALIVYDPLLSIGQGQENTWLHLIMLVVFLAFAVVFYSWAVLSYLQLLFDVPNFKGALFKFGSLICEPIIRKDIQTISIRQMRLLADSCPYYIVDARGLKRPKSWILEDAENFEGMNLGAIDKEAAYFVCSDCNKHSLEAALQIKMKGGTVYTIRNFFSHEREGKRIALELSVLREEGLLKWQEK